MTPPVALQACGAKYRAITDSQDRLAEMNLMDLTDALLTPHATEQIQRRCLSEADVRSVLANPESIMPVGEGRVVVHGMIGGYMFRVFVDVDRTPAEVVTVYRTSQLDKYRKLP